MTNAMTIPNAFTVTAILCGPGVLWNAWAGDMKSALALLLLGGLLCVLDGMLAEKLNQKTRLGDETLQPLAGLSLGAAGVFALVYSGAWQLWGAVIVAAIATVLQLISFFAEKLPPVFKRHQFWLHPTFSIVIGIVAAIEIARKALPEVPPQFFGIMTIVIVTIVALWRKERILYWLNGPKQG